MALGVLKSTRGCPDLSWDRTTVSFDRAHSSHWHGLFGVSVWWELGHFSADLGRCCSDWAYQSWRHYRERFDWSRCRGFSFISCFARGRCRDRITINFLSTNECLRVPADRYAVEKVASRVRLEERWGANNREFDRLTEWSEALRSKKRDLLHKRCRSQSCLRRRSRRIERGAYAKAIAEKSALSPQQ